MHKIILTDAERVQFVQMSGSDSCIASLLAALVISRKNQGNSRDERTHMSTQTLGNRLEALRKVEISRSKKSISSFSGLDNLIEMEDVYESDDGMRIFRDMMGAMQLRDEFVKFFDIHGFEPVIELSIEGIPGASYAQLSVLLRGVTTLTGISINITGFSV